MGAYDRTEAWELVGNFLLNELSQKHDKKDIALYRGNGLAIFKNRSGTRSKKIKKRVSITILTKWSSSDDKMQFKNCWLFRYSTKSKQLSLSTLH